MNIARISPIIFKRTSEQIIKLEIRKLSRQQRSFESQIKDFEISLLTAYIHLGKRFEMPIQCPFTDELSAKSAELGRQIAQKKALLDKVG